jgi:hypothetical protein
METNKLCHNKHVTLSKMYAKVKEKYFSTKYRPVVILLKVNAMISSKCQLQLKFKNKNYASMIVNFHTGLSKTIHYLKIYEELIYHDTRTTHWHTVTSFKLLKSHYSQLFLFKYTNDRDSVCPNCLDLEFKRPNSQHASFFVLFYISLITLTFSWMLKTFCFEHSHVITLTVSC